MAIPHRFLPRKSSARRLPCLGFLLSSLGGLAATLVVAPAHPKAHDRNPGTPDAPLLSIQAAVDRLQPGTTVELRSGLYREQVEIGVSGTPDAPIILKAAPGERPILTGTQPLTGWTRCTARDLPTHPNPSQIHYLDLPAAPVALYAEGRPLDLTLAYWPRGIASSGRVAGGYTAPDNAHPVQDGDERRLIDSAHLNQPPGSWVGAQIVIFHYTVKDGRFSGDTSMTTRIAGFDPARKSLTFEKPLGRSLSAGSRGEDRQWYRIQGLPELIAGPGEFAVRDLPGRDAGVRFYFWPPASIDLSRDTLEASVRKHGVLVQRASHVHLEGLEVRATVGTGIALKHGTSNRVDRCIAYYCRQGDRMPAAAGISLDSQLGSRVTRCLSLLNGYGIMQGGCTNTVVEGNVTGSHFVDALTVSWESRDVRVARNYVFDNWDRGHPDGFQTYRVVQRLFLDSNLFLSIGQGWQCAETQDAFVTNNIWAGVHNANCISCSLRPPTVGEPNLRNVFTHNLFFEGGVGTGGESRFLNNVVIPPTAGGAQDNGGFSGRPIESDFNLLWSPASSGAFRIPPRRPRGRPELTNDIDAWKRATGQNLHSVFAQPRFRHGPVAVAHAANDERGGQPRFRLQRAASEVFAPGDIAEVDLDGIPRTVREVGPDFLVLDPPPIRARGDLSIVWNWKKITRFDLLDLRLAEDSPGKGIAHGGRDPGSSIDIQAYMHGDLDADGSRDVPDLPAELRPHEPSLQRFLKW